MRRSKVIVPTVISSVFLACWIGLFIWFGWKVGSGNLVEFFKLVLDYLLKALTFKDMTTLGLVNSIGTYAFIGIYGIFAILTFIMMFVKKRPAMLVYFFLAILFAVPGIQTMSYFKSYWELLATYFTADPIVIANVLLPIGVLLFALLEAVVSLILVITVPFAFLSKAKLQEQKAWEKERKERIAAAANPTIPSITYEAEPEPQEAPISRYEIANMVRDIIRDEIARADALRAAQTPVAPVVQQEPPVINVTPTIVPPETKQETQAPQGLVNTVTGATFGGPLIVQYFYGVNPNQVQSNPQPVSEPTPAEPVKEEPAPVEEEVQPEPVVEETPVATEVVETPVVEETPVTTEVVEPVVEPAPVVEELPLEAKPPVIRVPFQERIVSADKEMKNNYNELKNELLSWGVKSRISNSGDTFRLHRKTYCKITVAGKSLKLYLALDPKDYVDSTIPHSDAGDKNSYAEIPFVFKVRSPLSMKRAKQLIQDAMEKDGLEQATVESVNWVKEIKASLKAAE